MPDTSTPKPGDAVAAAVPNGTPAGLVAAGKVLSVDGDRFTMQTQFGVTMTLDKLQVLDVKAAS